MKCQLVDKYILDYCDSNLSPELTPEIEEHLEECAMCSKAISLCKAENSILYNLKQYEPSEDFTAKVMQSIQSNTLITADHSSASKKLRKPYLMFLPVAAVILLLFTTDLPGIFNIGSKLKSTADNHKPVEDVMPLNQELHLAQNDIINDNFIEGKTYITKEESFSDLEKQDPIYYYDNEEVNSNQEMIMMASIPTENQIDLQVQNVPEEYSLLEIIDNAENSITYSYIDNSNDITLDITITKLISDEPDAKDVDEEDLPKARIFEAEAEDLGTNNSPLNNLSWELDKDNESYIISIQSNLSNEAIDEIYSLITITR